MDFLRRILDGDAEPEQRQQPPKRQVRSAPPRSGSPQQLTDEQAVERYRYLLQTAPPDTIEQAHAEAFARLTPEQRQMVLQELSQDLSEHERAAGVQQGDDPRSLARMATRAEMRQPGTLERRFGGMTGPGMGVGGLMAGSFLSSFAGIFIGSAIAQQFFDDGGSGDGDQGSDGADASGDSSGDGDAGGDSGDAGADAGSGDFGAADSGGGFGGDVGGGDFGGDFGGGDFGGGDFGGEF